MPRRVRLNKRFVDRVESDGSERIYWDHELPGFGLRGSGIRPEVLYRSGPRRRTVNGA